ncbi:MAG TPA: acetate--CoA ligase family protein [Thermoanaerobaculaceae bacterium]|nr:acetate--CoA ligase family protein [Thermoanaerobaculaceae bacterium]HRS17137.1 acetate--CoA ligase family protein [Thermoanaerobaculaceae bacterium]
MNIDRNRIDQILDSAAAEGRFALLESEVYDVLAAAGCPVPRLVMIPAGAPVDPGIAQALGGERVVLKVVSPHIAHKTDVGGVVKVAAEPRAIAAGVAAMLEEVPRRYARSLEARPGHAPEGYRNLAGEALEVAIRADIRGVMAVEMIACEGEGPGSESIFALRHNREFGPVVTMGIGGVDTELMGEACRKGLAVVSASIALLDEPAMLDVFRSTLSYRRMAGLTRGGRKLVEDAEILRVLAALRAIGAAFGHDGPEGGGASRWTITELEVNPFGISGGRLVALDGLLKFRRRGTLPPARPMASIERLMKPSSLGIIGVSARGMNMGRIILGNILASGFDPARMYVVRPDSEAIDGVRCVPAVEDLPERVDVFVVAVGAEQVPALMEELVEHDKAVGVILIPGGMGEKSGGETIEARIKAALGRARAEGRPLVANGGNCLGIVSRPGRYHTLFIPPSKLVLREDGVGNVGFISQSGAYMITRMSKLGWLSPRYAVSTGNQVDLTISDFVRFMLGDPLVTTIAVYVEGFKDGDGLEFATAVREVVRAGRDVIFYKAGRTAEGKSATSGHTASLAGDYDVCEAVVASAGALVARGFEEFLDLLKVSSLLGGKRWAGRRLAALSNAGYEAVGIADSLRGEGWHLELAVFEPATTTRLQAALAKGKLDALVDVHNPLDLTPMANDEAHEDAVRAFCEDAGVDLVLCSTIPLTPAMATLAHGVPEHESIFHEGSLPSRLARVLASTDKPIVVSIDCGSIFDPMAHLLEEKGLPTFRSADVAVRTMGRYLEARLRNRR